MACNPQPLHPTWTRSYQLYGEPHALWLVSADGAENLAGLHRILEAAGQAQATPEIVLYAIPQRDLNQASAGGFCDWPAYRAHCRNLAAELQSFTRQTGIRPRLYLEPDSVAHAVQGVLDRPENSQARSFCLTRLRHLADLVALFGQAGAWVYLDAGHSGWFGYSPQAISAMAAALNQAGMRNAAGITSNVANRQKISGDPPCEHDYLRHLLPLLDHPHPETVVDTSRNGGVPRAREYLLGPEGLVLDVSEGVPVGRWWRHPGAGILIGDAAREVSLDSLLGQQYTFDEAAMRLIAPIWLDPCWEVAPGPAPTDDTGLAAITRFRYIKPPDEADGALGYPPGASRHDTLCLRRGMPTS